MSDPQKPPRKSSLSSKGTSTNTYGRFNILIKTLAGTSFQVTTYPSDDIRIIKGRIAAQESLDPDYQHLLYHSREVFNYEIVGQIGLGEGSELTLVMTLRGGPVSAKHKSKFLSFVPRPATPMKDNRDHNEKRIIAVEDGSFNQSDSDLLDNDQVDFVLVKCDGNMYLYQIEGQNVLVCQDDDADEDESDESDDNNILVVSRCSVGGDVSSTAKNKKSLISKKQVAENRKTRVQMHQLQKKLANQREQKRAELMAKQRASLETARRRIPSPIRTTPISSPSQSSSCSPSPSPSPRPSPNISSWIPPLIPIQQQWGKSASYTTAVNTINLLRAEIILQSRRPNFHSTPGHEGLPYKLPQLERYVKSKLTILIEDEGYQRCFVPRACQLTPSVLITESYTVSSASSSTSSSLSSGRNRNEIIIERKGHTNTKETVHYNSPNLSPSRLPFPFQRELQVGHGHSVTTPRRRRPAAAVPAPAPPPRQLSQSQSQQQRRSYCQLNNILAAIEKQQDYIETDYDDDDDDDDDDLKELEDDEDEFDDDENDDDYWALIKKAMELQRSAALIKSARFKPSSVFRMNCASGAPTTTTEQTEAGEGTSATTATGTNTETMISSETSTLNPTTATQGTSTNSTAVPTPKGQGSKSKSTTTVAAASTNCNAKRCGQCKRKLSIVNEYECRCGKFFCSKHRHAEAHSCTFDYKEEGRRLIEKANPVITAPKLPQI